MTRSKRDTNETAIRTGLTRIGAWYCQMHRDAGFDLLVAFRGRLYIGEVKDPAQPPSKRKLTDNEQATRAQLDHVDIPYHVWECFVDVLRTIGALEPQR